MQTKRATTTELKLRRGRADDASELGKICFDAFGAISKAHNFPPDFPAPEVASGLIAMMISRFKCILPTLTKGFQKAS